MAKHSRTYHIKNTVFCLVGTLLIALGVNSFVIPGNLGEGGAIGMSLVLKIYPRFITGAYVFPY